MLESIAVILFVGLGWLWFDGLRVREAAVCAAREACVADGVQLLDDTVALAAWGLARGAGGRLAMRRTYRFEFSDTGDNRLEGSVTLLGGEIQALYLAPHGGLAPHRLTIV
ncbi:MAG: DUF3301 domain-containing protein [Burkholderiales bacterium]